MRIPHLWGLLATYPSFNVAQHATDAAQHPLTPLNSPIHESNEAILASPLLKLHRDLVKIESISGNEHEIGQHLIDYLHRHNFNVEAQLVPSLDTIQDDKKKKHNAKPRYNIYAYRGQHRNTDIVLTSHIDTVPPFLPYHVEPASTKRNNVTIHGRASADAKASVAAQIIAVLSLLEPSHPSFKPYTAAQQEPLPPHTCGLLFVVGEEIGGDGMRIANELDISPHALIFGEPTDNRLVAGHKGFLRLQITATGMAAHSGYPWLGVSANSVLIRALMGIEDLVERSGTVDGDIAQMDPNEAIETGQRAKPTLPRSKKYGVTTVNIGRIEGGVADNVIASSAHASFAIRIAAGTVNDTKCVLEQTVYDATRTILDQAKKAGKNASIELEYFGDGYEPVSTDTDVDGFEEPITVNYGTDVNNWVSGGKRYLYGPGSILVAHGPNERITVGELEGAVDDYRKLILEVLKKMDDEEHG